jgi:hypothetical protein
MLGLPQPGLIGARIDESAEKADFDAIATAIGELEREVTREAEKFQVRPPG